MNQALRRVQIERALEVEAKGSFSIIQRALAEIAAETGSNELSLDAVKARIRELVLKSQREDVPTEAAE